MSDEESLGSEEYEQRIDGDDVDDAEYEQQSTIDDKSIDEKDMTLEQRLNIADKIEFERSNSMGGNHCGRRIKKVQAQVHGKIGRTHKNAPAEMMSNRPVRRLRDTVFNTTKKVRDPRFSDISGNLNHDKFLQSYNFLEKYQETEIEKLEKASKKVKIKDIVENIDEDLKRHKQELVERRRYLKVRSKLSSLNADEKEKIKQGKKPFFMKRAQLKSMALEERFDELKKDGKLQKFLAKKRKHNASKDHKMMPMRRQKTE